METVWTVGHSTRGAEELLELLDSVPIDALVDVRTYPTSKRHPQFCADEMTRWLSDSGVRYLHLPELGGRRGPSDLPPETNGGWTNASFRNYADHTLTDEYERGISALLREARVARCAICCSEAVPWRCHRTLVSSTLVARGHCVLHLLSPGKTVEHDLRGWGPDPVVGPHGVVTYPPVAAPLFS